MYSIGLDYGTLSVRALLLDIKTGEEVAISTFIYPHGVMETQLPTGEKLPANWALQHPQDYLEGLIFAVNEVMKISGVSKEDVVGIGVDFTSSTVMPVGKDGRPLCCMEEYAKQPHAYVKLWKHHGGEQEAAHIDKIAKERGEEWLAFYGGKVSGELFMPKVLETLRKAPKVYENAAYFLEAMEWIIWQLTGELTFSASMKGNKAFYNHKTGYPSKEFFKALDPRMENIVEEKLSAPIRRSGELAGYLTEKMAELLGLKPRTPIGMGMIDSNASVLGSGIGEPGKMMLVIGTSACHMLVGEQEAAVPGCVVVEDGILPGYYAYEAGQSCAGDHFAWFVQNCVPAEYEREAAEKGVDIHNLLIEKLKGYQAGQSGLLALDWFNGVRSPYMDYHLTGMILGLNLQTKPEEIYLALTEATAYGTKVIVENYEKAGINIDSVILGGGIPMKNSMLVQVYADVLNRNIRIAGTSQTCATGAAILGAAAADKEVAGYHDICEMVKKLGKQREEVFYPQKENVKVYETLYAEYKTLCSYFAQGGNDVMKRLNQFREDRG